MTVAPNLSIMIVDDNHHMRVLVATVLRALNIRRVVELGDPADAFERMQTEPIDIIITDFAMQPIDGVEFVKLLRRQNDLRVAMTPVIMMTGHANRSRVEEARDSGVNEFLVKPITARSVIDRVNTVIMRPRAFVRTATYAGPDRRRKEDPNYRGPRRRSTDNATQSAYDLDF